MPRPIFTHAPYALMDGDEKKHNDDGDEEEILLKQKIKSAHGADSPTDMHALTFKEDSAHPLLNNKRKLFNTKNSIKKRPDWKKKTSYNDKANPSPAMTENASQNHEGAMSLLGVGGSRPESMTHRRKSNGSQESEATSKHSNTTSEKESQGDAGISLPEDKDNDVPTEHPNPVQEENDDCKEGEEKEESGTRSSTPPCFLKSNERRTGIMESKALLHKSQRSASAVANLVASLLHPQEAMTTSPRDTTTPAEAPLVVVAALKKLQAHVDNSHSFDSCALELAYCGVYLAVLEAMQNYPQDEAVQLEAVTLLWTCAVNDRASRRGIRQLGGVRAVAQALQTHHRSVSLYQTGYGLVSELVPMLLPPPPVVEEHGDASMMGDAVDLRQLVPTAVSTLRRCKDNARLVKRIATFLLRMLMVDRDATKKAILAVDGLKVTFNVMQQQEGNMESQQRARELMKALL